MQCQSINDKSQEEKRNRTKISALKVIIIEHYLLFDVETMVQNTIYIFVRHTILDIVTIDVCMLHTRQIVPQKLKLNAGTRT